MNKQILVVAWAVAATAALADESPNWKDRPEPVKVNVVNGKPDVPEDPAPTDKTHGGLQWTLMDPSYQFSPGDGIVINGQIVNGEIRPTNDWYPCEMVKSDVHRFRCGKKQHTPGRYKYTVKLLDQDGNPVTKDPVILNN